MRSSSGWSPSVGGVSTWDRVADLPLVVERYELEDRRREWPNFTRATTTIHLHGGGEEGLGEDVGYSAEDHDAFQAAEQFPLAGEWTLGSFCERVGELALYPAPPEYEASELYRRWAFEAAAPRGFLAAWARGWDGEGAPPYWPFIQIFPAPKLMTNAPCAAPPEGRLTDEYSVENYGIYCASPQNGQRSERACRGFRQCQQKRACGASRARKREWISCMASDGAPPADSPAATCAGRRAETSRPRAMMSASRSEAR